MFFPMRLSTVILWFGAFTTNATGERNSVALLSEEEQSQGPGPPLEFGNLYTLW